MRLARNAGADGGDVVLGIGIEQHRIQQHVLAVDAGADLVVCRLLGLQIGVAQGRAAAAGRGQVKLAQRGIGIALRDIGSQHRVLAECIGQSQRAKEPAVRIFLFGLRDAIDDIAVKAGLDVVIAQPAGDGHLPGQIDLVLAKGADRADLGVGIQVGDRHRRHRRDHAGRGRLVRDQPVMFVFDAGDGAVTGRELHRRRGAEAAHLLLILRGRADIHAERPGREGDVVEEAALDLLAIGIDLEQLQPWRQVGAFVEDAVFAQVALGQADVEGRIARIDIGGKVVILRPQPDIVIAHAVAHEGVDVAVAAARGDQRAIRRLAVVQVGFRIGQAVVEIVKRAGDTGRGAPAVIGTQIAAMGRDLDRLVGAALGHDVHHAADGAVP